MFCEYCQTMQPVHTVGDLAEGVVSLGHDTQHACPRCGEQLIAGRLDESAIEFCPSCRGILIGREAFGTVVTARRASYQGADQTPIAINPAELRERKFCPGCRQEMQCYPYYGPGNAVIDGCDHCWLIWLDAGELTVIEQAPGQRREPSQHAPAGPSSAPRTPPESDEFDLSGLFRILEP